MSIYNIDFETKSHANLPKVGAFNYATDPTTDLICMAYSLDDNEPLLWVPGDAFPSDLAAHIKNGGILTAWNSTFERLIWDFVFGPDYGAPVPALEQWHCSAFASRSNNMPGGLGNAARCLAVENQKQTRGKQLIKLLCLPLADGTFCNDKDLLSEMYSYCLDDVRAERAVLRQLRQPTPEEWQDFFVSERINDRGVKIDRPLAEAAQLYAEAEKQDLEVTIEELTDGEITKARGEKLKDWVVARLTDDQKQLLVKKRAGVEMLSLDKYNRGRLLSVDRLDPVTRSVVEASDFAQKSSVSKFKSMCEFSCPEDDRARGVFMCTGAAASGRYSSRNVQAHNFPRSVMENPAEVRARFLAGEDSKEIAGHYWLSIMSLLSKMLRSALIPAAGCSFVGADWSAIEGRVAPWLADSGAGLDKLKLYVDKIDTYKEAAAAIYSVSSADIDSAQRQVGKVAELSLQFGGGAKAFAAMARGYGVAVEEDEAELIKKAWRLANPWAVSMWAECENAAFSAVRQPGTRYQAGRVSYFSVPDILCGGLTLFCELPSGRLLTYPDVRVVMKVAPWGDEVPSLTCLRAAFTPKANDKTWPRSGLYGGLLFENIVQGVAADLLREALAEADYQKLPVVIHVHDEIIIEAKTQDLTETSAKLSEIMLTPPDWAAGLPLAADVEITERFGK